MSNTQQTRAEGAPEQLVAWLRRQPRERRYRVTLQDTVPDPAETGTKPPARENPVGRHSSAMGKYAFVSGGSEAFANEKQAEIDREDRSR